MSATDRPPPDETTRSEPAKKAPKSDRRMPAAGPHATPELTNDLATPGAGTLPEVGSDDERDSTSG